MSTQKDFATIRAMADKKLLNADQKKVLVKLFEVKIETLRDEKRLEQDKAYSQAEKDCLAKMSKTPAIMNAIAKLLKAEREEKEATEFLEKNGLRFSDGGGYGNNDKTRKLELAKYCDMPAELVRLKNQHNGKLEKIKELKLKLLADINCLPMTYAEINDYIEGELEKI